ncbi:MAG: MATE family efflux transporter [Eubacteriales bacterium]|nr:MATE family efflux transporter [Eubacteriales bacterium]
MMKERSFLKAVCNIAIPITLQSMLQASFSVVDQIMIGQLGSVSIAGIGLAGKFSSVYSVLLSAVATIAGIMIAQYIGQKDEAEVRRSFLVNLIVALATAVLFFLLCLCFPGRIMGLYTSETATAQAAAGYLRIVSATFLPMAGATLLSTVLRCREKADDPLYAGIAAALVNTGLNYALIFGKMGFPALGVSGAALATVIAQFVNFGLIFAMYCRHGKRSGAVAPAEMPQKKAFDFRQYAAMLLPILITEFMWSLGENVYAMIYGKLGTQSCAAMTLLNPIQSLTIGALSGLSAAASIIIGKSLGEGDNDRAYRESVKLMLYGLCGSAFLSALLLVTGKYYVRLYQVEEQVRLTALQILVAYALISPVKVQNMIVGGGVLRSGGKTKYIMWIDIVGTWVFGVPLGLCAAFWWKLSIPYVYFILSLEECVRLGISLLIFRKRGWMQRI